MGVKHSKSLIKKLDERDLAKIKLVFNDLAAPSNGKGIDMDTFKQFSQFADMVAERAFVLFSTKKPGLIDLDEFIAGLALCYRGSEKDKLKVIYRILGVTTDKVSKDEIATVLNQAVSAPSWNASTREDLKPPTELVQKLIEMGFPRVQCDKAVEATKATTVDEAVAWIVANKPDPLADAHILLASMFEGHTDGYTTWKKFKKWAMSNKRPHQFTGFLNGFPALYERAILWSSTPRTIAPPKENLIDFTLDDIKPSVPTPIVVQHTGGKEPKRRSHRSLSQLMNRRSMDSIPPPVNTAPALGLGSDSFLSSDIPLTPSVPSLVPTPLNAIPEAPGSAPGTPDMPRLPSNPTNPTSAPTTPLGTVTSFGSLSPSPSPSNSTPTTPTPTTPTPVGSAPSSSTQLAPPSPLRTRAHSSLGHATKKAADDSDDDWSDDEDEQELKPAIQVFIKPKSEIASSTTAPALAPPTVPALGGPKAGRPSTVGARSRNRPTNKMAIQSSFFDPQWAETAAKARNSLADDDDSSTTTSTPTTPTTPSVLSAPTTPSIHTTPVSPPTTPTTAPPTPSADKSGEPSLVKFASQASLEGAGPSKPANKVATEHMKAAMSYLEKGNFADSLREVNESLHSILDVEDRQTVKGEANFCVAYKVALGILLAIRDLEGKFAAANNSNASPSAEIPIRMAFLSKILSDIPLKTNHRIVCVRMAISKNMHPQAANYAVAARLVEALLLKGAPDREALQAKLKKCKEDEKDNTMPTFTCPSCSNECSSSALKCSCGRPVRWCFKTYELIATQHFLQCSYCNALLSPSDTLKTGDKCEFCEHGTYEER